MAQSFQKLYSKQLPQPQRMTTERFLAIMGSLGTLIGLYLIVYPLGHLVDDVKFAITVSFLCLIILVLLTYIFLRERGKTHRYAQCVFYTHYANHIIRDFIDAALSGKQPSLQQTSCELADSIASCFSVLSGRRCRCSIKELTPAGTIDTVARDEVSTIDTRKGSPAHHPLSENSDFEDIWYGRNGCYRYFLSNDLIKLYKQNKYRNSSFRVYGEPVTHEFLGFVWVKNWSLPYRSAIIWPVRHIPNHAYWPHKDTSQQDGSVTEADKPRHWGFLCVDCGARNAFDTRYAAELGAGFADALYTLYSVANYYTKSSRQPSAPAATLTITPPP